MARLRPRERDGIVQALRAGVVPKLGLEHIQVGRADEIGEMVKDIDRIADGGSTIRFVIGEYGSGKTFFMNLARLIALEKGLVTMFADLAPDRRLHASGGQARALYAELARNLSTRTKPDGGGLPNILERFVGKAQQDATASDRSVDEVIADRLGDLEELTGGYDFAQVIRQYWQGFNTGDDQLRSSALRWLRGEFSTKTDARTALGVRTIVDDASVYDHLKLMAAFCVAAGYNGLLIGMDEMVNLFKLSSAQARKSNYEQILRILNDVLQGSASNMGFLKGGTPEFLMDTRRGLFSYEALQSRLAQNTFAQGGLVDMSGPVIRLANLTPEDMFVLLQNIRAVMQDDDDALPDKALTSFMDHCSKRIGESYFRTPRNTVTAFVNMIAILQQNPGTQWSDLIGRTEIAVDHGDDMSDIDELVAGASGAKQASQLAADDNGLSTFKL